MMLLQRFHLRADHVDLVSLKTRKLDLRSSKPFNWDHRSTDMRLSWIVFVVTVFIDLFLLL